MNTQFTTTLWRWTCALLLAVTLVGIPTGHSALAQGVMVRLDPVSANVGVGNTVTVNVVVENVTDLLGYEVHLTYDPIYVDVEDADTAKTGVQIQPGTFVPPEMTLRNEVNLASGNIDFAITAINPDSAASGNGTLAVITFRGKTPGTSPVIFSEVILISSTDEIATGTQDGQVVVTSQVTTEPPTAVPTDTPVPTTAPNDTPVPTTAPADTPVPTATPTSTPTPDPQQAILSLSPADTIVAPNGSVTVKVQIANVTGLYGVDFYLNGGGISVSSIAEGPCIADLVAKKEIANGEVHYAASLQAPSSPFSGNCDLATITFIGDPEGNRHLTFGTVTLSTVDGRTIPATVQNGIIRVTSSNPILCNHVVQPRESLFCIGRGYGGVDPYAIASHNHILNPGVIYSGQVLAIPAVYKSLPPGTACPAQCDDGPTPTPSPCRWYHTVAPGENMYRIGLRYGVSMYAIAQANHIVNMNYIRAGQVLCIP